MSPPGQSRGPHPRQGRTPRNTSGKDTHAEPNSTEPSGAALLMNALSGVEGKPPHWTAQCPCHDDMNASLDILVKPHKYSSERMTVLVFCPVCHASLTDVCDALGVECWRVLDDNERYRNCKPAPPRRLIRSTHISAWHTALMESPEHLAYLTDRRGLTVATMEEHWLGFDHEDEGGRYTLPVWAFGGLVNVRRYDPNDPGERKMLNTFGLGKPARLYPSLPTSGPVVVCEGEWDALVLRQHGFPAVTSTHGAATFLPEWVPLFAGRHVAFLFDCDDAGRKCSAEHAAKVATVARSVRVVDLDPARDDKWDVSDWFSEGRSPDDLRVLINRTLPLGVK